MWTETRNLAIRGSKLAAEGSCSWVPVRSAPASCNFSDVMFPKLNGAVVLGLLLGGASCSPTTSERLGLSDPATSPTVDLKRYMGTWFEIASYPTRFQAGCTGTTATYELRSDGTVSVTNRCRKPDLSGQETVARGHAQLASSDSSSRLKVSFFWPFYGDYWILERGEYYEYAVVGHPSRDYLWILSREKSLPSKVYAGILERLRRQGFETTRLRKTIQIPPKRVDSR